MTADTSVLLASLNCFRFYLVALKQEKKTVLMFILTATFFLLGGKTEDKLGTSLFLQSP